MESETFTYLIADLQKKSSSRDPQHVRLSSVTAAIVDVINREGLEVNAPRVYSKAVVTLEGTLQKKHVEIAQIVDSVNTQSSLLELVHLILPMLESSTVSATFLPVSRAIRNLIDLIQSISTASAALNIKDDTGCIALVLATTAKTSSTLIKCASKSSKAIDEKHIKIFFRSTLRAFLASESQRVRRVAKDIIGDLLRMENPKCHPSILRDVNAHVLSVLDSVAAASDPAQKCAEMLGVLDLTRSNVAFLDPGIWQQLMFVLVSLLKRKSDSNPDFVMDGRGSSSFVFVINLLLSAVVNLMESSVDGDGVKEYSGRVLATLLQIEPILIFQGADHETSSAGRALIAQAILKGTSRVVDADSSKVAVFLPIAIGRLFELARDQGKSESETQLTQSWFLELTQILRVHLHALRARDSTSHAKCCLACLHVSKQVCSSTEHWVNQGALVCLAEVIIQVEPQAGPVEEAIKDLISRRCKVVGASPSALALEDAVHRVVQGLGIDKFWRLIDFPRLCFAMRTQTQNCSWLLKVMRLGGPPTGVGCASLAFFQNDIVPVIHDFDTAECNGDFNTRRQIVVELWSLLPCFCVRPNDIAASLPKLAPFLVRAMKEKKYPQLLVSHICQAEYTLPASNVAFSYRFPFQLPLAYWLKI
jgi:NUC173 domain